MIKDYLIIFELAETKKFAKDDADKSDNESTNDQDIVNWSWLRGK